MKINAVRKPQEVVAFRFRNDSDFDKLHDFCGELVSFKYDRVMLYVTNEEMFVSVLPGDWVVRTKYGEYSVVSPEVFAINYELVGGVDV